MNQLYICRLKKAEFHLHFAVIFLASIGTAFSVFLSAPRAWSANASPLSSSMPTDASPAKSSLANKSTDKIKALGNVKGTDALSKFDLAQLRSVGYKDLVSGDYKRAEDELKECVRRKSDDALSRKYLAYALIYNGQPTQAVTQYEEWSKLESLTLSDKIAFGKLLGAPENKKAKSTASFFFEILVDDNSSNVDDLIEIANACCSIGLVYGGPTSRAIELAKANASDVQAQKLSTLLQKINEFKKPEDKPHFKGLTPEDMKLLCSPQLDIGR